MKKSTLIASALVFAMSFPILAQDTEPKKEPTTGRLTLEQAIRRNRMEDGQTIRISGPVLHRKPLVVVDGVIPTEEAKSNTLDIKAANVASITVLTDPNELALYGAKGTNGVILVTTKRGKVN